MNQRPIVLLLIPHLGGGGAERVTELLARGLSAAKYEVHLGLITQATPGQEPLPPWVHFHGLGAKRVRTSAFRLLRLIHQLQPDVVLSSMAHLNFLVLLLRPFFPRKTRVLVRQNGTVTHEIDGRPASCTRLLYRLLYPRADRIVCQTWSMQSEMAELLGTTNHLRILPNPMDIDAIRAAPRPTPVQSSGPGPHLLAVGRLSAEIGFDFLLEAFKSVLTRFLTADLTILGTGPDEYALKSLCQRL